MPPHVMMQELLALRLLGLLPGKSYPLRDSEMQFNYRWEVMHEVVRPQPVSFEQVNRVVNNSAISVSLLSWPQRCTCDVQM